MKTLEMFKNLANNPKQLYQCSDSDGGKKEFHVNERGYFYFTYYNSKGKAIPPEKGGGGFSGNICLNDEWELVREPVDFMTAINSGKKIKYESWIDYYDINRAIEVLIDRPVGTIRSMIDDKWYIED